MDQWAFLALTAVIGLMAVSVLKTILGSLIRYVMFVAMAAAMMKHQEKIEGFRFLMELDRLQDLAFIGGIGFALTLVIMTIFFHKSRMRIILYPLIGAIATYASWAFWPNLEAMWQS